MTKRRVQVLRRHDFASDKFFKHLQKGSDFYQNHDFARAIEEWVAASRLHYLEPVNLKRIDGRIFCASMIEEVPFLFILYVAYINKITGMSVIKNDDISKKLFFRKGVLISAATNKKEERIGKSIVKKGTLTPESLEKLVKEAKTKGKMIGSYLIEKSLLTPKALKELLALQVDEILSDIFLWDKGEFYIVESPVTEEAVVSYTPLKVALLSARRWFNFSDFRQAIPSNKAVFRPSPYAEEEKREIMARLKPHYQFVYSCIDGVRNIDQLIRFSGLDEVSVIDILYRLNGMGLIRKTQEVIEYEDKEFTEVSKILEVLFEVYRLITGELFNELGRRGEEVIQKSRKNLKAEYQKIFADVPLEKPEQLGNTAILRNIAYHFPSPDQRPVFIDAFLGIYINILDELKKFLGIGLTKETAKRIRTIIANIEIFSMTTSLKQRLLKVLNQIARKYV